jgi:hypothetical protein
MSNTISPEKINFLQISFDTLGQHLRAAIGWAHTRLGIDEPLVASDISVPVEDTVILSSDQIDPSVSLYDQMDTRVCLDYLFYGGLRKSRASGGRCYCKDQDAFFEFFQIKYGYTRKNGKRELTLEPVFCEALCSLHRAADDIIKGSDAITLDEYFRYVFYMQVIASTLYLHPDWDPVIRAKCNQLIDSLATAYVERLRKGDLAE